MKNLSLHSFHESSGAVFKTVGEYTLPAHYGLPREEYQAAQNAVALTDVSYLGKLVFKGPDRQAYLHGQLTNDIKTLLPGQGLPTCILTPKGKLVADFTLYNRGKDLLALTEPDSVPLILKALEKSLPFSETSIENQTENCAAFQLLGPRTLPLLNTVSPTVFPDKFTKLQYHHHSFLLETAEKNTIPLDFCSDPRLGTDSVIVLFPQEHAHLVWSRFLEAGQRVQLRTAGFDLLEILRAEAGIPRQSDMDSDSLPLEFDLEPYISFSKGCYLGQETTARIKTRGHVNRKFSRLKLPEEIAKGSEVVADGRAVGIISTVVYSPRLGSWLGLGLIRSEHAQPGCQIEISAPQGKLKAEVISVL